MIVFLIVLISIIILYIMIITLLYLSEIKVSVYDRPEDYRFVTLEQLLEKINCGMEVQQAGGYYDFYLKDKGNLRLSATSITYGDKSITMGYMTYHVYLIIYAYLRIKTSMGKQIKQGWEEL